MLLMVFNRYVMLVLGCETTHTHTHTHIHTYTHTWTRTSGNAGAFVFRLLKPNMTDALDTVMSLPIDASEKDQCIYKGDEHQGSKCKHGYKRMHGWHSALQACLYAHGRQPAGLHCDVARWHQGAHWLARSSVGLAICQLYSGRSA